MLEFRHNHSDDDHAAEHDNGSAEKHGLAADFVDHELGIVRRCSESVW